ncbi:HAD-IB family phosphatase [Sorangium sp. So ce375]|uniref:HAD-IB family phosphatase n=1 Tax=Sorangium sp. So ce375 TaxID=3133306 RepID=UPI003F5BDCE7
MSFSGYNERPRRGGGALIVNELNEVLLLLRSVTARNDGGLWSQPGGALSDGDATPEAAVRREILEELGIQIRVQRFLTATCHRDHENQWIAYSYLGQIEEGECRRCEPEKHDAVGWFRIDQLPENINHVTSDAVDAYHMHMCHGRDGGRSGDEASAGLIIFDMDGTLLPGTTANLELARILGAEGVVLELERSYCSGLIDNHTYASRILDLYSKLSEDHVEQAFKRAPKLNGLLDLVSWTRARRIDVAVLTTGPAFFASKFKEHFRFDHVIGGMFPVHRGPIEMSSCVVMRDAGKPEHAQALCTRLGVPVGRCVVVGDSRSDVALFGEFQNSIALNSDDALAGKALYYLRTLFAPDLIPAVSHVLR